MVFLRTKTEMSDDAFKEIIEEESADVCFESDDKESSIKDCIELITEENLARLLVDFKNLKDI